MCSKSIKCCGKKIQIKRFFLPFVGIWGLVIDERIRNYIYLPIIMSLGFIIFFWNFPIFVYFTNSKPIYYEDMWIIDENINQNSIIPSKIKDRINFIFLWILIITNSLLLGGLSDYWIYKTYSKENFLEILGITGGILKIFQLINDLSAKFLIIVMRRYIKKKAGSFNVMDISPNSKDMSPSIRVIQLKKKKTFEVKKRDIEMKNLSKNDLSKNNDIKLEA